MLRHTTESNLIQRGLGLAAALLLGLALSACGAGRVDTAAPGAAVSRSGQQDAARAERARQWQEILARPGTPGVDYLPDRITVTFKAGARLPAGLPQIAPLPAGRRAADQGNAMLRADHSYEPLADAIAAAYNLTYRNQVYNHAVRMAAFQLPRGANGDQVIQGIRQQFGGAIDYVTYSRLRHLDYLPNDPYVQSSTDTTGEAWHVWKLHCPDGWDVTKGTDQVRIAILDTGVNLTHEELQTGVLNPTVWFPAAQCDPGRGDNDVTDDYSHGSGTAGLAVATQDDGLTMTGVAPDCRVIPIRVADANNQLSEPAIIEGGYLAQALGAKVISMSFGGYFTDPTEEAMVSDLHAAGLLLCASAGNEDTTDSSYPASYDGCFSVGATNIGDARISHAGWWGSDYGPAVAIAAPGEDYTSCSIGATDAYQDFGGTSGACPQVAACAALAWTIHPEWTNDEVRAALIETALPTTGFIGNVPRVDLGNFMQVYGKGFRLPVDNQLIKHGVVHLTPTVYSGLTELSAFVDGTPAADTTSAPWDLDVDLSAHPFGTATLRVDGSDGNKTYSQSVAYAVDNSPGAFPLFDNCDAADANLLPLDVGQLNPGAVGALYLLSGQVSGVLLSADGSGQWQIVTAGAYDGGSYYCGLPSGGYGPYELDALLLKRLDLSAATAPSLTFMQRYNLEDGGAARDRGYVLVSSDYGATWTPATLHSGQPAMFTGYQADWAKAEVDLSAFAGQQVHVALVMMSDAGVSGENTQAPGGWWVDDIAVSSGFGGQPRCSGVTIGNNGVGGAVLGISSLGAKLQGAQDVDHVSFNLDCAPLGQPGGHDVTVQVSPDRPALLTLPTSAPNQVATLTVTCYGSDNAPGQVLTLPVYIFNLRGDANGDNAVNQADVDEIQAHMGAKLGDPGYAPFCDSDHDGVITEADIAAVGYAWGKSL